MDEEHQAPTPVFNSLETSPYADIEINSNNLKNFAADLTLEDFKDEDLSEITEENEINQSFINGSFKGHKVKFSANEISERMRKITADMVQIDLGCSHVIYEEAVNVSLTNKSSRQMSRPHTLLLFSEPCAFRHASRSRRRNTKDSSKRLDSSLHSTSSSSLKNHEDAYEEIPGSNEVVESSATSSLTRSASEWSIEDPDDIDYCYLNGEMKRQTHTAQFKFVPRHNDEMELDINDPVYINQEFDDFWCEGVNMRTGDKGICPSYYVQTIEEEYDDLLGTKIPTAKYFLYFLGSLEVPCHKGNDVLCQAMHKVAEARRQTLHSNPPAYVCLIISTSGVKMIDQSDLKKHKKTKSSKRHNFRSSYKVKQQTHFFQMKNVSFCGHHPTNSKYFGFITRHPTQTRFACHTFVSEKSTRDVAETMGIAFSRFYKDYLDYIHPNEDFYME